MSTEGTRKTVVGIDLGTTYSCIAYVDETGNVQVSNNKENESTTPSVVNFPEGDEKKVNVGQTAKDSAILEPNRTAAFVKVLMGKSDVALTVDGVDWSPSAISAEVLKKVVEDCEALCKIDAKNAVITVPAYFGDAEVKATQAAGEIAGLKVLRTVQEPVAAAVYYGCLQSDKDGSYLVYDLGGGTFDATVIAVKHNGDDTLLDVVCADGDHDLGGRLWDSAIVDYLADEYRDATGFDDELDEYANQALWDAAEKAKKHLTDKEKEPVMLTIGGKPARIELTRETFNAITSQFLSRTIELTAKVVEKAASKGYPVDRILLVGGSTLMPQVSEALEENFSGIPIEVANPHQAVARGAAICALEEAFIIANLDDDDEQENESIPGPKKNDAKDIVESLPKPKGKVLISYAATKSFGIAVDFNGTTMISNLIRKDESMGVGEKAIVRNKRYSTLDEYGIEISVFEHDEDEDRTSVDGREPLDTKVFDISKYRLPIGSPIDVTFKLTDQGRLYVTAIEPGSGEQIVDLSVETHGISEQKIKEDRERSSALLRE